MEKNEEYQYLDLIKNVIENGVEKDDRTGIGTKSIFGATLKFNLQNGFPLLTTKKVFWKGIAEELLFFIKGQTNSRILEEKGIKIWQGNTSREFLDKRKLTDYEEGDMGPCFVGGTHILTFDGYKAIENVQHDDLLYTHNGNMKEIEQIHVRNYTGDMINISVKYHPHDIVSTPEHPFYARKFVIKDRYQGKRNVVVANDPEWVLAKDITKKHLLGFKIETAEIYPQFLLSRYINQHVPRQEYWKTIIEPEEWFMMGYFLGDGWLVDEENCKRIHFAINLKQAGALVPKLSKVLNIQRSRTENGCHIYRCCNQEWANILSHFGKYAHGKKIPNWVHLAPKEMIEHFITGYWAADGCTRDTGVNISYRFTTVSVDIAYSIQRLYLKLGKFASNSFQKRGYQKYINDKLVNQRDCYFMEVYENKLRRNNYCFVEGDYAWFTITDTITNHHDDVPVYNFTVKDDNTYTVSNLSVHNCYGFQWRHWGANYIGMHANYDGQGIDQLAECIRLIKEDPSSRRIVMSAWNVNDMEQMVLNPCHIFVQFYVANGKLSCMMIQRSADCGLGLPFNIASYALLTHLVAHVTDLLVGELTIVTGDTHVYLNHVEQLQIQLTREPKPFPTINIKGEKKNIDDYTFDDIELVNYLPHPAIKMEMAI